MGMVLVNFTMHIHDVVTRYNNCTFLCAWNVNITIFCAYHCVVLMSYILSCIDVLVDDENKMGMAVVNFHHAYCK